MKRSLQEILELVAFGLIALVLVTILLWIAGWLLGLIGLSLQFLSGLLWFVLKFLLPVAIVVGAAYAIFILIRQQQNNNTPHNEAVVVSQAPTETVNDSAQVTNTTATETVKAETTETTTEKKE